MKKRTVSIFLILILVLISCLVIALPVIADNPPKPVAWVNGADCSGNDYPGAIIASEISVKYLSDGTTVGKVITKILVKDKLFGFHEIVHSTDFESGSTYWERDGDSKKFQFVYISPIGNKFRVTMVDNGEGKNSLPDTNFWEQWNPVTEVWDDLFHSGGPVDLPNGNNQIHLPDYDNPIPPIPSP